VKKGRISKEEDFFIKANVNTLSIEELAIHLDRNINSVADYVKRKYGIGTTKEEQAAYSLKDRPYYYQLTQQFTEEEVDLIQYHWARIVSQFDSDVLPTEELQIIDVVKIEMLMNRALETNRENIEAISRAEIEIAGILRTINTDPDPEDAERVMNLERQIGALRGSQDSINRDYRDLQARKSAMLKDMKATREQRIKRLEDSKESFPSWVATLLQDSNRLREYGVEMEKMRLAMEGERKRLGKYHKYEDGTIDQPLLNYKTILGE
jgi:hypothetical protein